MKSFLFAGFLVHLVNCVPPPMCFLNTTELKYRKTNPIGDWISVPLEDPNTSIKLESGTEFEFSVTFNYKYMSFLEIIWSVYGYHRFGRRVKVIFSTDIDLIVFARFKGQPCALRSFAIETGIKSVEDHPLSDKPQESIFIDLLKIIIICGIILLAIGAIVAFIKFYQTTKKDSNEITLFSFFYSKT